MSAARLAPLLLLLLQCLADVGVLGQRRYSKFGVPQIYQRVSSDDDAIVFPGEASSAFQSLYEETVGYQGPGIDRFRLAAEALFSIAVRLQGLLEDPNSLTNGPRGNFLVSPLSVTSALGQLAMGSRGESHRQLGELLSLPGRAGQANRKRSVMQLHLQMGGLLEILRSDSSAFQMHTASAFFVAPNLRLFPRFKREVNELYGTQVISTNFGDPVNAMRRINTWVSQQTHGRIPRALAAPLPVSTAVVLSNSIYMKAAWRFPFSRELTKVGPFRLSLTQQVQVPFMRGQFNLGLADNPRLRIRVLHMPYKRSDVGFYIILPYDIKYEEYDIHNVTSHLTVRDMVETLSTMKQQQVTVAVPRMSLKETFSVKEPLRRFQAQFNGHPDSVLANRIRTARAATRKVEMNGCSCTCPAAKPAAPENPFVGTRGGFPAAIGNRNGFPKEGLVAAATGNPGSSDDPLIFNMTNASNDPRFRIQDIVHQMFLEVNEEGTEAAAATTGTVDYAAGTVFRVDRPFTLFVRHETTLATLFWGSIVNPAA
ncbi:leukocyte elastase inhibitor-like [Thrips palmi]|uniref:Leukocyte elastase inhibitor-like n=1 Tax=Thrips palmi TaxID=161013 RepID=A0A6P9A5G6_THRPL|nr:leukocyte elastase inhibitor-like [Thrips palmi]